MLTFYSDDHRLHHAQGEMLNGELQPCFEMPARADHVLARVREREIGEVLAPRDFGLAPIARIHTADYLDFLRVRVEQSFNRDEAARKKRELVGERQKLIAERSGALNDRIIGEDYGLRNVIELAHQVAELGSPVLLRGETGTGNIGDFPDFLVVLSI